MNKKLIIKMMEQIALYMEIKGENSFKISAYRRAAQALESDSRSLDEIDDISNLKGIGKGTLSVIEEMIETGQSSLLEELKEELPDGLIGLLNLPGLGGKKISKLYHELGITDIQSLKEACETNKVQAMSGFGKKTEEKILEAIEDYGKRPERLPIAMMLPITERIEEQLEQMKDVERYSRAGSIRRYSETIKDIDFIIGTQTPEQVVPLLEDLENVTNVIASGSTKVSVVVTYDYDISVDFRLVKPEEFATTLHHFTGSKDHNVKMRQLAKSRSEKISEYGVEDAETGEITRFKTEEDFFRHFGLTYIPPQIRQGKSELEIFQDSVPYLERKDIKSDLHMHTTWSDGANSIEEMAEAARNQGYSHIVITDHSQYLVVANGLTPERILKQQEEIRRVNEKYDDFTIFSGIEMDILPDGTLDYDDGLLEKLDFVIASIHSAFSQNEDTIMKRLETALNNPHVDLIAHPTGRIIGRRDGYAVDVNALIDLAAKTNTALELNANPNRLDLAPEWLAKAQDKGVKVAINTDAHVHETLDHMDIGVNVGQAALLRKENVLNTYTLNEFRAFLNRHK
ncbi:DNA polymerase/3'-5' exonuclease PolX [Pseudalkalibacillus berkeleyi]|uniref:DNA-directed DNA polymerase n=1 Tax=Pseudalkalibacillus berkeleyi TaxID=1069813 RepID=A0ABS9GZI9_9BACL|nr:DNA polymerase/3'-5' exonuclease PolX [Pseudalkalibacillus berkeleyi]MCF6138167.1 DNA polymerase/3'-5' exonuclease PolX [Pseudalkalibacillus berkeleyi]